MEKYKISFKDSVAVTNFINWANDIPSDMDIVYGSIVLDAKDYNSLIKIEPGKKIMLSVHGGLTNIQKEQLKYWI